MPAITWRKRETTAPVPSWCEADADSHAPVPWMLKNRHRLTCWTAARQPETKQVQHGAWQGSWCHCGCHQLKTYSYQNFVCWCEWSYTSPNHIVPTNTRPEIVWWDKEVKQLVLEKHIAAFETLFDAAVTQNRDWNQKPSLEEQNEMVSKRHLLTPRWVHANSEHSRF